MDLVGEILSVSGVRGTRPARVEAAGRWGIVWHEEPMAVVYAVTSGAFWLGRSGQEPRRIGAGDVVLLPIGVEHSLSSEPDTPLVACDPAEAVRASQTGQPLRFGIDGDPDTVFLAAAYQHDPAVHTQLLPLLPALVHARAGQTDTTIGHTVRLLGGELSERRMGTSVAIDRVVDVLLVQLLRIGLDAPRAPLAPSLLRALADPLVAAALEHLHRDPAHPWTIDALAARLLVSRTTLIRRFTTVIGESVGSYLSRWRMDLASLQLRDTDDTLETIARASGYQSVQAFTRAFTHARGLPPARYRQSTRTACGTDPALVRISQVRVQARTAAKTTAPR